RARYRRAERAQLARTRSVGERGPARHGQAALGAGATRSDRLPRGRRARAGEARYALRGRGTRPGRGALRGDAGPGRGLDRRRRLEPARRLSPSRGRAPSGVLVPKFTTSGKHLSLRGARRAPKQSRKDSHRELDCFAALAMTIISG